MCAACSAVVCRREGERRGGDGGRGCAILGHQDTPVPPSVHAVHCPLQNNVPIYAVKTSGSANLVKAFRTLLGIDPSPGGTFGPAGSDADEPPSPPVPRASSAPSPSADAAAAAAAAFAAGAATVCSTTTLSSVLGSDDDGDGGSMGASAYSAASSNGNGSGKGYNYKAWAEDEALEEAQTAVTEIVIPLHQPVELAPRAPSVLDAQVRVTG